MTVTVAIGRLAAIEGTTTTWKTLYKPGAGVQAVVDIAFCNRSASTRTIRLAQAQSASADPTPADGEMKIYERTLAAAGDSDGKDVLVYRGMCLNSANNDQAVVYVSGADVDITAEGTTETTT